MASSCDTRLELNALKSTVRAPRPTHPMIPATLAVRTEFRRTRHAAKLRGQVRPKPLQGPAAK
jgi:hypothetical protein